MRGALSWTPCWLQRLHGGRTSVLFSVCRRVISWLLISLIQPPPRHTNQDHRPATLLATPACPVALPSVLVLYPDSTGTQHITWRLKLQVAVMSSETAWHINNCCHDCCETIFTKLKILFQPQIWPIFGYFGVLPCPPFFTDRGEIWHTTVKLW